MIPAVGGQFVTDFVVRVQIHLAPGQAFGQDGQGVFGFGRIPIPAKQCAPIPPQQQ